MLRRRQWHPTPVLLPGKSHGQRSLVGCSPWGCSSQTRLSDFTFTFHFPTLEKEMATHSSVLAWRIPRTGEPGGLPSMGSHRVGHDWSDLAAAAAYMLKLSTTRDIKWKGEKKQWSAIHMVLVKKKRCKLLYAQNNSGRTQETGYRSCLEGGERH